MNYLIIFVCIPSVLSICGQPACGGAQVSSYTPNSFYQVYQPYQQQQQQQQPYYQQTYQPYQQLQQLPQPPEVHPPQIPYYYQNSYAVAPQQSYQQQAQALPQVDKETSPKNKELDKLKPTATIIKTEDEPTESSSNEVHASLSVVNVTSPPVTYVREFSATDRPMPYRPLPYIPKGCQVTTQYIRPYLPRGYVQTVRPATQAPSQYVTPPSTTYIRPTPMMPPPINDCCGRCGAPCKYRSRKTVIALASKIFETEFVPRRDKTDDEDEPKDPKCNSEKLKDLMNKYTTRTVSLSKRLIQKNAEAELGGYFSVICSMEDFSYVARSEIFCQHQKNDILCYAFKHQ